MKISEQDKTLIHKASQNQLTYEEHILVMERLKDKAFEVQFNKVMYADSKKTLLAYLPLILFILLILLGATLLVILR